MILHKLSHISCSLTGYLRTNCTMLTNKRPTCPFTDSTVDFLVLRTAPMFVARFTPVSLTTAIWNLMDSPACKKSRLSDKLVIPYSKLSVDPSENYGTYIVV